MGVGMSAPVKPSHQWKLQTCPWPPAFPVTGWLMSGLHLLNTRPKFLPTCLFNRKQPSRLGFLIGPVATSPHLTCLRQEAQ